jgi:hypothetical protein
MPKLDSGASSLASLLDGSSAGELIPELARHGLQQLIELEVAAVLGADRHERSEERLGYRNGYRSRSLTTQVGDIDLLIPKLRAGSFLPSILEPRRRVDQALYAVIMEAYIGGVSTLSGDNEVGRSATSSLAGWVSAGVPGADAQGPGDAGTTDESPTQPVHGETTWWQQPGGCCRSGGHFSAQCPPD